MRTMSSGLILEIVEGPGAGTRLPIEGRAEIGRSDAAAIALNDPLVSRHHAIVEPRGEGLVVEDLGSLNGTFVNVSPIHGATVIRPDDQLQVGVTVLELRSRSAVSERPSAVKPVPAGLSGRIPSTAARPSGETPAHRLHPLLDSSVKKQARAAPLAIFLLIVIVLSIVLTIR
jgi:pSer/pThr/pTyr-binding forkhead associated (FHA) protein